MRYNSYINNVKSLEWGLNLHEAYLFSYLHELPSWATVKEIGGIIYFHASRNKSISELPMLTDKPDTMYRHYRSLEEKRLIFYTKFGGEDYIGITDLGKGWNSEKNPNTEINLFFCQRGSK